MMLLSGFSRARKAKIAICWFFFMMGIMFGNWGGILPEVKKEQGISNTVLGGILVAAVAGAMIALPIVNIISKRFGSGFSLFVGSLVTVFCICLLGLRENIIVFVFAVMALGFGAGWMDVAMNCQAVLCEKMTRTPTLGLFHSMSAIGGLCGALIGGSLIELGFSVLNELVVVSLVQIPFVIFLSCWLYSYQEEKLLAGNGLLNFDTGFQYEKLGATDSPLDFPHNIIQGSSNAHTHQSSISTALHAGADSIAQQNDNTAQQPPHLMEAGKSTSSNYIHPPVDVQIYDDTKPPEMNVLVVCGISLLCLLSYFGQGSVSDWSAIFLTEQYDTSPLYSVLGLAGFNFSLCAGTFFSDYFVVRWGRNRLLIFAGIVSAIGLLMVSLSPLIESSGSGLTDHDTNKTIALSMAIVGFAIFGLGNSVVPPSVISIAGSAATGMNPNEAIALVSSAGYIGIMIGPALLGGISGICHGLQWSFLIVALLMVLITVVTKLLSIQEQRDSSEYTTTTNYNQHHSSSSSTSHSHSQHLSRESHRSSHSSHSNNASKIFAGGVMAGKQQNLYSLAADDGIVS